MKVSSIQKIKSSRHNDYLTSESDEEEAPPKP